MTNVTSAPRRARARAMSIIGPAWPPAIIGTSTKCGAVSAPAPATAAPLPGAGDMTGGPGEWLNKVLLDTFVDVWIGIRYLCCSRESAECCKSWSS